MKKQHIFFLYVFIARPTLLSKHQSPLPKSGLGQLRIEIHPTVSKRQRTTKPFFIPVKITWLLAYRYEIETAVGLKRANKIFHLKSHSSLSPFRIIPNSYAKVRVKRPYHILLFGFSCHTICPKWQWNNPLSLEKKMGMVCQGGKAKQAGLVDWMGGMDSSGSKAAHVH